MKCNHVDKKLCYCNDRKDIWIKVTDKLPEEETNVIGYGTQIRECSCGKDKEKYVTEIKYRYGCWLYGEFDCEWKITHWMPFPQPPKH